MRNTVNVVIVSIFLAVSLLAVPSTWASDSARQTELLRTCQNIAGGLILPNDMTVEQRTLVALQIAIGQSEPMDQSFDLTETLRQAVALLVTVNQSDTFYLWETDHWEPSHRSSDYYKDDRKARSLDEEWTGSTWVNDSKTIYGYNLDGTQSSVTSQTWTSDSWVNEALITFTYAGGVTSQMLYQTWSGTAWQNYTRSTLTYSGGNLATTTTEIWQSSAWVNLSKTTHTYTGGYLTNSLSQTWSGSAWVNQSQTTFTLNGSHLVTLEVTQTWSGAWTDASKHEYDYDGSNNEILDVFSIYALGEWMAMEADTSKWSGGRNIEIVYNHIISFSVSRSQFTYDGGGNRILDLGQDWSGDEWVNSDRSVYVYGEPLAVQVDNGKMPSAFELSQNYPNPFNPVTAIRYSLHRPSQVIVTVFNVLGQEVRTLENGMQAAGTYETTWDGTDRGGVPVASGIYFYRIKAGDFTETRKMVLLK